MAEQKYILALDQGTTSSRALVINREGKICSVAQKEFGQIFPKSGWVEHDPNEIWSSQASVAAEAIAKINISERDIAGSGSTDPLFDHQCLHAYKIEFTHPIKEKPMVIEAPLSPRLQSVIDLLRTHRLRTTKK